MRPPSYGGKELLQLLIQAAKKGVYTHQEREHISLSLLPVLLLLLLLLLTELVIKRVERKHPKCKKGCPPQLLGAPAQPQPVSSSAFRAGIR